MIERNLFDELKNGLVEIRDHPETLRRSEMEDVIEIAEANKAGICMVSQGHRSLGFIGRLKSTWWIAIPETTDVGNVDLRHSVHKLRRDAIDALH